MDARIRAWIYVAMLLVINVFLVKKLFFVEFTDNMQTNAGSFMAIGRFILQHWPHLGWFPWWFNGEPFENAYSPMLPLLDAAFAWITGCSPARAFNFVTAFFYATAPVFLFLFAWRVSRFLETSFFAALLYSLFSPSVLFHSFRSDVGGWWNPWRMRVLVHYGEGPHIVVLSVLPLALLLMYLAVTKPTYLRYVAAGFVLVFLTLVNAFGGMDLAIGGGCIVLAFEHREIPRMAVRICAIAIVVYMWSSPFLTPTLLRTISTNSQYVEGDFSAGKLLPVQALIVAGFICAWFATRAIGDYFMRFSALFTFVFCAITGIFAVTGRAALPQPNRYSLEMELGMALAVAFSLRFLVARVKLARMESPAKIAAAILIAAMAVHQTVSYRRYARTIIQKIDITQTIEYRIAKWMDRNLGSMRALTAAQAGTWLNVFSDTPQMDAGHGPFNPNWAAQQAAAYAIYSGQNAGARDAANSILWLKAYGCHAVHVPGPASRVSGKPFANPGKFKDVLPVLWHEEDDTIYAVPQRTRSLAHVVPADAVVKRKPIHGLDTIEVEKYVSALDDPELPTAAMTWLRPDEGHIDTVLNPGEVISVQSTYDPGWTAVANGHASKVTRDGIGLTVIHAACQGACSVDFVFDGGRERKVCRIASWAVALGVLIGAVLAYRKGALY